jgi:2-isopropylmalate synthase
MWRIFADEYLPSEDGDWGRIRLSRSRQESSVNGVGRLTVEVADRGETVTLSGEGQRADRRVLRRAQPARHRREGARLRRACVSSGRDATAAAYIECEVEGQILWGVGIDPNIVTASLQAIVSAVNRAYR